MVVIITTEQRVDRYTSDEFQFCSPSVRQEGDCLNHKESSLNLSDSFAKNTRS